MSDSKYSKPFLKRLFGRAIHCAYPGCRSRLYVEHRGVWSLNAQIAHIRSPSPNDGPRYDASYPVHLHYADENVLLLCHQHHVWIDDHPDLYSVDELLDWREKQIRQEGGSGLDESQIARIVEAILEVRASTELLGVIEVGAGRISVPISELKETRLLNSDESGRFIGVSVTNHGAIALEVHNVGIDIGLHGAVDPLNYQFPAEWYPGRPDSMVGPLDSSYWIAHVPTIGAGLLEALKHIAGPRWPETFRAYAVLGTGQRIQGDLTDIIHLPIWGVDVTSESLRDSFRAVVAGRLETVSEDNTGDDR